MDKLGERGLSQTAAEFILLSYTGFVVKGQRRSRKEGKLIQLLPIE